MKMQAFRVREVMVGHSSTAAVVGEDAQGRQVRLEVGALEGASIQAGELLVLNWATVAVPAELDRDMRPTSTSGTVTDDVAEEEPVLGRDVSEVEVVSEAPANVSDASTPEEVRRDTEADTRGPSALDEFKALIGLR
jgi:hypothetical protein